MIKAIYPGSFDPLTNGHLDIIKRASQTFDELIIAVSQNINKTSFLNKNEKIDIITKEIAEMNNVKVQAFDSLLVDFAKSIDAKIIIRGLRAVSDFEYEFQLAGMNRHLNDSIETVFLTPSEEFSNISSSLIKEIYKLGGDISQFVPKSVVECLKARDRIYFLGL